MRLEPNPPGLAFAGIAAVIAAIAQTWCGWWALLVVVGFVLGNGSYPVWKVTR